LIYILVPGSSIWLQLRRSR